MGIVGGDYRNPFFGAMTRSTLRRAITSPRPASKNALKSMLALVYTFLRDLDAKVARKLSGLMRKTHSQEVI
jgi:hypothetical protein